MSSEQPSRTDFPVWVEIVLVSAVVLFTWPAFVGGLGVRALVRRLTLDPSPYWLGLAGLGLCSLWLLIVHLSFVALLVVAVHALARLPLHMNRANLLTFLAAAFPVWERSLLLIPWSSVLIDVFIPRQLSQTLLTQERQRRAIQARQSRHASQRATHTPDQINGKGVLGVLVEHPDRKGR